MGYTFAKRFRRLGGKVNFERDARGSSQQKQLGRSSAIRTRSVKTRSAFGLNSRQQKILDIIKNKGGAAEMSDLLSRITGVTERTLRRDLLVLSSKKLVSKKGTTKSAKYYLS